MRRKRLIRATAGWLAINGFGSPGKRGTTGECRGCGVTPYPGYDWLAINGFGSPGKRSATGECPGCGPGRDSVIPRPDHHHFVAVMLANEAVSLRQTKRCLLTCAQGRVTGAELSQRLPVLQSLRRLAVDVLPVHV